MNRFPLSPLPAKGTHRIAGKEPVTTIIFSMDKWNLLV
jgi:hypothetical protein